MMFSHAVETPVPVGETMPRPVTTTLRFVTCTPEVRNDARGGESLGVVVDVVDGLLDGRDLLGLFVRDVAFEFFFERHHEFHRVERAGTQVVDEGRFRLDVGLIHTELFRDDPLDTLFYGIH